MISLISMAFADVMTKDYVDNSPDDAFDPRVILNDFSSSEESEDKSPEEELDIQLEFLKQCVNEDSVQPENLRNYRGILDRIFKFLEDKNTSEQDVYKRLKAYIEEPFKILRPYYDRINGEYDNTGYIDHNKKIGFNKIENLLFPDRADFNSRYSKVESIIDQGTDKEGSQNAARELLSFARVIVYGSLFGNSNVLEENIPPANVSFDIWEKAISLLIKSGIYTEPYEKYLDKKMLMTPLEEVEEHIRQSKLNAIENILRDPNNEELYKKYENIEIRRLMINKTMKAGRPRLTEIQSLRDKLRI